MLLKAALVWLGIAVLAGANGGLREGLLKRLLGERVAHVASTLLLGGIVLAVSFLAVPWIGPSTPNEAWLLGGGWLAATLAFEFLAGHYLFGNPWTKIVHDYDVSRGRVWLLVPLCTLMGPPFAFRGFEAKWALPYAVSNVVAIAILVAATTKPQIARWSIVALFAYAALYNGWLALDRPEEYQGFASLAFISWYSDFIAGPFKSMAKPLILAIAAGQALCATLLALGGRLVEFGAIGVTLFLMAIAPLGVGSAFPFSLIVSLAAFVTAGALLDRRSGR
ncbi:MAG TPA: hypothetical protein PLL78_10785 [Fimbriimonadaceae bacterium]|nr:hypothetical protein [Fimbriimonadaceae bacterium]HRJ97161.1 hypothetical protein [Fimbriimonadaceae bacterium]